jgi:hypothetical protein
LKGKGLRDQLSSQHNRGRQYLRAERNGAGARLEAQPELRVGENTSTTADSGLVLFVN